VPSSSTVSSTTGSSATGQQLRRWQDSGCARLTGPRDGSPLLPPPRLISSLESIAERIRVASKRVGSETILDPLAEVALRATTHGYVGQGRTTCGGAGQLLRCTDGWLAVNLPRPADLELVPALVELNVESSMARPDFDWPWAVLNEWCRSTPVAQAVERGVLLGLPVAEVGEASSIPAVVTTARGPASRSGHKVLDLSSLWAGPLCAAILVRAGFDVLKLESVNRPDGSKSGPPAFNEIVNGGKRRARFDPRSAHGRQQLREAIETADVVIESSRPRALQQLGIDRDALDRGPQVWLSITAYGREGDSGQRVGFGDDTAAAGGLLVWDDHGPLFCADAIADPISGMLAAATVLESLAGGECQHIDVAMAGVSRVFS
jgi:hypothetical protein